MTRTPFVFQAHRPYEYVDPVEGGLFESVDDHGPLELDGADRVETISWAQPGQFVRRARTSDTRSRKLEPLSETVNDAVTDEEVVVGATLNAEMTVWPTAEEANKRVAMIKESICLVK